MNQKSRKIFVLTAILTLTILTMMVMSVSAEDIYINNCSTLDVEGATYYLTADIINSTAYNGCMHVQAENVTLDCQMHIIDGVDPIEGCPGFYSNQNSTTIKNCVITDWAPGIYYVGSNHGLIQNNTLNSNTNGIFLRDSSNSTIEGNTLNSNIGSGILFQYNSLNNNIYNNHFNSTDNVGFLGSTIYENYWNTTRQPGTRIYSSGIYISGNYWTNPSRTGYSDTCTDADHDGFCDEPYTLAENNTDHQPLSDEYGAEQVECWNDTFDNETKIAEKNNVTVEDGDVEIDLTNLSVSEWWHPDSLQAAGLGDIGFWSAPEMAFNIRGDDKWNLIAGRADGYYWDSTQWISDSSLVAGLGDNSVISPAIAFNITGDGRWNLIAGSASDGFYGYYWNDTQWISDPLLVTGLGTESWSDPAIAFNITGDGKWNLIYGYGYPGGGFYGYYWDGTQWISNSSLVVGLGDIGTYSAPTIAFNITGNGKRNLIAGNNAGEFLGYYWNGSQWVNSPSLALGLVDGQRYKPSVALKDGKWCLVGGKSDGTFYGFVYGARASITSEVLSLPADDHWLFFFANDTLADRTHITYKILDEWNNTLMSVVPGQVITDITDAKVRLSAELITGNLSRTPVLHDWKICCVEGLPGGVLKEKKRLTFDPNSSTGPSVATDSAGNLHLVWCDDRDSWDGSYELYYKKLAPDGTVLINDRIICCDGPGHAIGPKIVVDSSGSVHIAFNNTYYMKLDNTGNIVIEPKAIELLPPSQEHLLNWEYDVRDIAVDYEGDLHMVVFYRYEYYTWGGEPPHITGYCTVNKVIYTKLDNNGIELVNYTIENRSSCGYGQPPDHMDPTSITIAVDSECNAYTAYRVINEKVWYAKMDDNDVVQKEEVTEDYPSLYPSVCADFSDNKYVIWSNNVSNGYDLYLTKLDKSDNKVIDCKRLTYDGDDAILPIIDTGSGIIHVTWSRDMKIYYMAFDTSGNMVMDRMLLSPPCPEIVAKSPSMDAVSDGSHIVWDEQREHDSESEIYFARLMLPSNRVVLMSPPDQWTPVDVNATYMIGILSTVPYTDTFNLTLENLDGALVAELGNDSVSLDTYATAEINLTVGDAEVGDYRVKIRAESQSDPSVNAEATIITSVVVATPELTITTLDAYHNDTGYSPYFNLSNEVDVEVENTGTADAGAFNVSLYVDDEFFGKQTIAGLGLGESISIQFIRWIPEGTDCEDGGSSGTYTLKAIADCDGDITESNESNNELTAEETVYWAGWSADEQLNLAANGTIRGGMIYTTGDGGYVSSVTSTDIHYNITLPEGASVEHARLYVYYTWCKDDYAEMKVSIGGTEIPSVAEYNDRPCNSPAIGFNYPYGTYVYDLTPYVGGTGTYTVTVERVGGSDFCIAAPGMLILYEDNTEPEREYWILEGADILEGGRRGGAGYLSLEECTNKAIFTGDMDITKVINATLGMVLPWGGAGGGGSYYWFNDDYLGDGSILGGYSSLYQRTVDGMSMYVSESNNAQIGVNVSDIIDYIAENNNTITIGDDGDSMMAANAFLLIEYGNDTTSPNITDYAPVGDENWVGSPITVTFSETMNKSSAEDAFSTVPVVNGTFEWFVRTMTFTPGENLACNTIYNVTIGTGAKDRAGNNLESPFDWEFTTQAVEDTTPPNVTTHSPTGENVSIFTDISVTFSELMNHTSTESAFSTIPDASGTFTWNETTMTFSPDVLEFNTTYNVAIAASATDLTGNTLDGNDNGISEGSPTDDYSWQFTTEEQGFKSYDYDGFPLTTKSSGIVNGGVFISYGDNDQMKNAKVAPYVTNFSVPNSTPVWAKLYMHLWGGNPYNGGTVNVTFNSHDFETVVIEGKQTSDPHVLGTGCGTWWLFFNVTDLITPGDINRAQVSVTSESMDGRIARIVLVEAYEGGDDPQNVMYWVNDGHMNLHYNSSEYPWCIDSTKAWFNGTVPSGVTQANLTGIWLTGSYEEPDYFYFSPPDAPDAPNGSNINWDIGNYSDYQFGSYDPWTGSMSYHDVAMGGGYSTNYFDIHSNTTTNTSTITNILKDDNNYAIFWRGHDDNDDGWIYGAFSGDPTTYEGEGYVHAVLAALVLNFEGEDITPPYTDGHDPAPGDVNVAVDTNITVHVKDSGAGVNVNSIEMKVNNVSVIADISGTSTDYELFYDPPVNFSYEEVVNVSIDACDLDDNCMLEAYLWEFTIESEQTVECGDVDGENGVTIGDGIQVAMYTIYGSGDYPLTYPWAADVDCENGITIGDGIQIAMSTIYGTVQYPLECC